VPKKPTTRYVCTNCGATSSAWSGRCNVCGEWNTLEEQLTSSGLSSSLSNGRALTIEDIDKAASEDNERYLTGLSEVDNVFGGGIVSGSVSLIAGQPGIGKSTLLLQVSHLLSKKVPTLYVSGEESAHQIGLRAKRLGTLHNNLQLATSTVTEDIAATISSGKYKVVVVDSIQSIACSSIASSAGTVSQITNSAQILSVAAKQSNTSLIMVGHVTKEGNIAGPKVLEHAVDVVMQLEGDRYGGFKLLRAVKNRFGSTNETGIFEMEDEGLKAIANPSAALLEERQISDGSIVLATIEGSRPLLVEVQALVNPTSYGYPKRAASGFDINRLNLLVAMLERRTKIKLAEHDIYINLVGGLHVSEPAADLAICMAIGSAVKGLRLKNNSVVFGEVGLSGEIRHVPFAEKRLAEANKLGFDGAIGPAIKSAKKLKGLNQVKDVRTALNLYLEKG
jgi:DNA repair protein RadA/Sms